MARQPHRGCGTTKPRLMSRAAPRPNSMPSPLWPMHVNLDVRPRSDCCRRLDSRRRLRRRRWLRAVLLDIADGTCSVLEHGYLVRVERPQWITQGHTAEAGHVIRRRLLSRCRIRRTARRRTRRPGLPRFIYQAGCGFRTGSRRRCRRPFDSQALLWSGLRPAVSNRGQDRSGAAAAWNRRRRPSVRATV